jgi:hypothetical protein
MAASRTKRDELITLCSQAQLLPIFAATAITESAARGIRVDFVQVCRFVHADGLSFKKAFCPTSSFGLRSLGGACSARSSGTGLTPRGSSFRSDFLHGGVH